ncbi:MAG: hypothetical protein K6E40_13250 [Desulfovibrio sp.]|nr:hypothetical protein [Desulfovibrio sp.]
MVRKKKAPAPEPEPMPASKAELACAMAAVSAAMLQVRTAINGLESAVAQFSAIAGRGVGSGRAEAAVLPALLLTAQDAGSLLVMSAETFRRRVREGLLPPPVQLEGVPRWRRADVEAAVAALPAEKVAGVWGRSWRRS